VQPLPSESLACQLLPFVLPIKANATAEERRDSGVSLKPDVRSMCFWLTDVVTQQYSLLSINHNADVATPTTKANNMNTR
jgi:hypothetical protein